MQFGFAASLSAPWLYAWDYLDLIVFLLFADFVINERPWQWVVALYSVAIWNRDSAQFIALWFILEGIRYREWRVAAVGVIMAGCGAILMEFLRAHLMVQEMGPIIFSDAPVSTANAYFGWNLADNRLRSLRIEPSMPFMPGLFVVGMAGLCLYWAWKQPKLATMWVTFGVMAVAVPMFAVISETRTLIYLIPALVARAAYD
jgi:hypothetical protein